MVEDVLLGQDGKDDRWSSDILNGKESILSRHLCRLLERTVPL